MNQPILYVGLDSEYVQAPITDAAFGSKHTGLQRSKNDIVCYSGYAIYGAARWEWIALMPKGKRMKFAAIIGSILAEGKKQGAFKRWPKTMNLAIHWSLADFSSLDDLADIQHEFDSHRKGFVTFGKPYRLTCYPSVRNKVEIDVNLYDTLLLAPEGNRQLKAIGNLLGVPKLEVSDDEIENARCFSEESPERFRAYAIQDARIAAEYVVRLREVLGTILDEPRLPKTLSSVAEAFALEHWYSTGVDVPSLLGKEEKVVNGRKQLCNKLKYHLSLPVATEAFHGGFAVASIFGPSGVDDWSDWDLSSAYLTSMSVIGMPDWDRMQRAASIEDFTPDVMGAALIRFSFPPETRFPCIPVRSLENLIFPLQGTGFATAPEIHLARRLGARMELIDDASFIVPMDMSIRPFRDLAVVLSKKRQELERVGKKDSLEDLIFKLIGNAIYGKLAQATQKKRVFDARSGKMAQAMQKKRVFDARSGKMAAMPESCLTNPYLAGAVTGLIRATLIEILNELPPERTVLSATTDGFISNATAEEVVAASEGWLGNILRYSTGEGLDAEGKPSPILKLKHCAEEVIVWATRGQCTSSYAGDPSLKEFVILAKRGIMCPFRTSLEQNEHLVARFLTREFGEKTPVEQFRGLREIYESRGDLDLNRKQVHIRYNMDFDWKRVPIRTSMHEVKGISHLWFDTAPLVSEAHFAVLRKGWQDFRDSGDRVLKTETDLRDFMSFLSVVPSKKLLRSGGSEPAVEIIQRMFLRAYRRRMWGLDGSLKNTAFAETLTDIGLPTSVADVENAGRASVAAPERCLYRTPQVIPWLSKLKDAFPGFDEDAVIVADPPPWEYSAGFHAALPESTDPSVSTDT